MDNNSFKSVFYIDMTPTHSVAFYGLHSEKTPYIKRGPIFNTTTDLSGHADSDIGATAVSAIQVSALAVSRFATLNAVLLSLVSTWNFRMELASRLLSPLRTISPCSSR